MRSLSAVARTAPSGLNATAFTPLPRLAGMGEPISRPVATDHRRAVPSPSAVASTVPAGLKASPFAPPGMVMGEPIGWSVASR